MELHLTVEKPIFKLVSKCLRKAKVRCTFVIFPFTRERLTEIITKKDTKQEHNKSFQKKLYNMKISTLWFPLYPKRMWSWAVNVRVFLPRNEKHATKIENVIGKKTKRTKDDDEINELNVEYKHTHTHSGRVKTAKRQGQVNLFNHFKKWLLFNVISLSRNRCVVFFLF